eukprot:scaffold11981_cov141-Isochrysis_galbana.AAC.2
MLTFVGILGPPIRISTCAVLACALWSLDVYSYSLSTPTAIIHSCPMCFNPQLPNPQIYPARSISQASAQFQVRDPTVEREGPVVPLYGTYDCAGNHSLPLLLNP